MYLKSKLKFTKLFLFRTMIVSLLKTEQTESYIIHGRGIISTIGIQKFTPIGMCVTFKSQQCRSIKKYINATQIQQSNKQHSQPTLRNKRQLELLNLYHRTIQANNMINHFNINTIIFTITCITMVCYFTSILSSCVS